MILIICAVTSLSPLGAVSPVDAGCSNVQQLVRDSVE